MDETVGTTQPSDTQETPPPSPSDRLASMTDVERQEWRKTGTVPGTDEKPIVQAETEDADGETADESDTPAPVVDATAAAEAGKALNKRKQTAQQRINDLAREKFLLQGELNALRQLHSQSSPRPAAAVEQQPSQPAAPPILPGFAFPPFDEWLNVNPGRSYEDYSLAGAAALIAHDRQQQMQVWREQQVVTAFATRVAAFKAETPDYDTVTSNPDVIAIANAQPYLHVAIRESDLGPQVAYYLGTHLDECRALASSPTAAAFDRAFGKLEARLEQSAPAAPNHVSRTPPPPPTLGSRPVVPADDVDAAVAAKDVGAYLKRANAREVSARR